MILCFFYFRTVPKVYRKVKALEHKSRKVFGVSLLQSVQQSGKPLPPSILRAMEYLRTECLDQVCQPVNAISVISVQKLGKQIKWGKSKSTYNI